MTERVARLARSVTAHPAFSSVHTARELPISASIGLVSERENTLWFFTASSFRGTASKFSYSQQAAWRDERGSHPSFIRDGSRTGLQAQRAGNSRWSGGRPPDLHSKSKILFQVSTRSRRFLSSGRRVKPECISIKLIRTDTTL
jgi:hypothetical protein